MKMRTRTRRGYSLIEVLISSVILAFVVAMLYMVLSSAGTTYSNLSGLADAQERARRVMDQMATELRSADVTTMVITPAAAGDSISFTTPDVDPATGNAKLVAGVVQWNPTIQYAYQPSTVDANHNLIADEGQIVRIQSAKTQKLTDYVKSGGLKFTRTGENLVIQLTFISCDDKNRVIDTTLRSSVTLRNAK